ncbi:Leucine-rich repeat protein kinase family protein [Rhynchospora pubera]|uniref:non-specific serine/threonine protein kinase n=1 Tax=Rhynchospora pubera TaxID=906938 RepID=A0AAV8BUI6_9POAL|nr:Leucine-rich repeat protein kinase family protein [Rhynchospora pubera]
MSEYIITQNLNHPSVSLSLSLSTPCSACFWLKKKSREGTYSSTLSKNLSFSCYHHLSHPNMFEKLRFLFCASGFNGACYKDRSDCIDRVRGNNRVANEPEIGENGKKLIARRFGWTEVESITGGFNSAVIGEGGFSTVYLARFSKRLGAVKLCRSSERLQRLFRQELDVLRTVNHPHIVRLLGFCDERDEGVLVMEFVPNGNLHEKLHGTQSNRSILSWSQRMVIAFQLAKALEYLHELCDPQIIHGDIKASNILLDGNLHAKICDFGSARVGFSATVQPQPRSNRANQILGSPGYVDPHFLRSGMITKKSDVYSFGVLLLELITGVEAFCTKTEMRLTVSLAPQLSNREKGLGELVDEKLGSHYDAKEGADMVELAMSCIGENPSLRPSMTEVVRIVREKAIASISSTDERK